MDFNKLTTKSQEAIATAQELARRAGNPELYPEHLVLALLDQDLPRELVPDAAARSGSRAPTPRGATRRSPSSAATSHSSRRRASSTRSSDATRRSGASSRC